MRHIVLLTKAYRLDDFETWYKYHKAMGWTIHVIDNESTVDVHCCIDTSNGDTYDLLKGWPDQWQLYDDLLADNRFCFNEGDYVAFIDDDEYLWFYMDYWKQYDRYLEEFRGKVYETIEEYLEKCFAKGHELSEDFRDVVAIPQILMSSRDINDTRVKNVIDNGWLRRDDKATQCKVVLKYHSSYKYRFNGHKNENGHVPAVDGVRCSIVDCAGLTNTTYALVNYVADMRLYHYHIKSLDDWKRKYDRGSAAVDHQWYDRDIHMNHNAGGYVMPDFTMMKMLRLYGIC